MQLAKLTQEEKEILSDLFIGNMNNVKPSHSKLVKVLYDYLLIESCNVLMITSLDSEDTLE